MVFVFDRTTLLLNIVRPADTEPSDLHRLIWCPYMPEDDDDVTTDDESLGSDQAAKLLVLTHGNLVCISTIKTVSNLVVALDLF